MNNILHKLLKSKNLMREESYELFSRLAILDSDMQAMLLALLHAKQETVLEILGALDFFEARQITITNSEPVIDIVGTGGDDQKTFNISTAASLVVASCGVKVAKHGGRSATSTSGSMDIVEALALPYAKEAFQVFQMLNDLNYAYLPAPVFNPFFKLFQELRKKLGFTTMFNILGPLLNPMKPKYQVMGVYRKDLLSKVAEVLLKQGSLHALVVHSADGLDEFSLSATNHIAEIKEGKIFYYDIEPYQLFPEQTVLRELRGGSVTENAEIIKNIFLGREQGAKRRSVLINSAAGLYVSGKVDSLQEGITLGQHTLDSGKTFAFYSRLKEYRV